MCYFSLGYLRFSFDQSSRPRLLPLVLKLPQISFCSFLFYVATIYVTVRVTRNNCYERHLRKGLKPSYSSMRDAAFVTCATGVREIRSIKGDLTSRCFLRVEIKHRVSRGIPGLSLATKFRFSRSKKAGYACKIPIDKDNDSIRGEER